MSTDYIIITVAWVIGTILLIIFVPKDKIKETTVIFLFKQVLTWLLGLTVVQLGLIEYPVRLFPKACQTSFSFEYFLYPVTCVMFNLYYPVNKGLFRRFLHYASYCSVITIVEVIVEKNTKIIDYIHWEWYITWITLFLTFYLSRKFYVWFNNIKS